MKIKISVSTNKIGSKCEHEIEWDDDEWAEMSERERDEAMLDELWNSGMIDWHYREVQ